MLRLIVSSIGILSLLASIFLQTITIAGNDYSRIVKAGLVCSLVSLIAYSAAAYKAKGTFGKIFFALIALMSAYNAILFIGRL